ncbi:hypothetical protein HK101_010830 [Irineochytrium annulatum]|nr:hypothetical protein HK101_010830 [Irineochytrium annulatum]
MAPRLHPRDRLLARVAVLVLTSTALITLFLGTEVFVIVDITRRTSPPEPLRFNPDGLFTIVQFTDLHYGEAQDTDWGPQQDVNSTRVIRTILSDERPDLVAFTGDQITGENIVSKNVSKYVHALLAPLVERNLRWATAFGNHDNGGIVFTPHDLMHAEMAYPDLSMTLFGPHDVHGVSNYYVPIYPPKADVDPAHPRKPAAILWFLDTNGNSSSSSAADWVKADQVAWFLRTSTLIAKKWGPVPSLAFFHIPLQAQNVDNKRVDFEDACDGFHDELGDIAAQDGDEGFAATLASAPTPILAAFTGHDHGTGWCCPGPPGTAVEPIMFCFGKHTGYGGYGNWDRGARVIKLDYDDIKHWSTWIRMENSSVVYPLKF